MPVRRILSLVFAVAAAVAVLSALAGLDGGPATTAGVLALLTSALGAILFIRRPLARWALAAGIVVAAAAWTVREVYFEQVREAEYAAMVLLVIGVAALLVGTVALPQFHRPAGLTAAACPVALVPVTVVAVDAADERALSPFVDLVALYRQLAPGLLATVLAGLVLVLVVSRADRWFLAPAGAALLQSAVAQEAWGMSGSWYLSAPGTRSSSVFLHPGMRTEMTGSAGMSLDLEIDAAMAVAAWLIGPAMIVAGAVRTAGVLVPGRDGAAGPDGGGGLLRPGGPEQPAGLEQSGEPQEVSTPDEAEGPASSGVPGGSDTPGGTDGPGERSNRPDGPGEPPQ